jgi:hypothetical protein
MIGCFSQFYLEGGKKEQEVNYPCILNDGDVLWEVCSWAILSLCKL